MDDTGAVAPHRRRRALTLVVCVALGSTVIGLTSAQFVKSPSQAAADAAPPAPSVITAPVEARKIADAIPLRGTVKSVSVEKVSPAPPAEGMKAVVTAVRAKAGTSVKNGDAPIEVSGRPVFLLTGAIPMYRDIQPGDTGRDVSQLQSALRSVGYGVADRDGFFGPSTQTALGYLYARDGYQPPQSDGGSEAGDSKVDDTADGPGETSSNDAAAGVSVLMSEVVFVRRLPSAVLGGAPRVGAELKTPALTLTVADPVVVASLNPADRTKVKVGQEVAVTDRNGVSHAGRVSKVGRPANDENSGGVTIPLTVTTQKALPRGLVGDEVQVSVVAAQSADHALVVPLASVTTNASGETFVTVVGGKDQQRRVPVTPHISGAGFVEIEGKVREGERVLITAPEASP